MWTQFYDMHSGGGQKEEWNKIYIEAPKEQAKIIFYNRFGHNPEKVTCTCCGDDYSISEYKTLGKATEYERRGYDTTLMLLAKYKRSKHVLFIYAKDIKKEEYEGCVPEQGYVWKD